MSLSGIDKLMPPMYGSGRLFGVTIVGEQGPEIVSLLRSGAITPSEARSRIGLGPLGTRVTELCDYCGRRRINLTDNCLGCGAAP